MFIKSEDAEREAALEVAILGGEDKNKLADEMERAGLEKNLPTRIRDAGNVRNSEFVILLWVGYEEGLSERA
jgi:uncharacterized ferredoxin-like protein